MPKVKFIIHFFLEILHFKEPCNFIGWQQMGAITRGPEFCQIWGWCWNINKDISFHFRLLPRKTNDKFFKKIQKTLFGAMWPFWPFLAKPGQKWIFLEKRISQFLNIPIICHRAKNQKKLICHSWGKCWTDGWMGRQTEGQTDNHDFVEPSVGRGPIIKVTLSFPEFTSQTSLFY